MSPARQFVLTLIILGVLVNAFIIWAVCSSDDSGHRESSCTEREERYANDADRLLGHAAGTLGFIATSFGDADVLGEDWNESYRKRVDRIEDVSTAFNRLLAPSEFRTQHLRYQRAIRDVVDYVGELNGLIADALYYEYVDTDKVTASGARLARVHDAVFAAMLDAGDLC